VNNTHPTVAQALQFARNPRLWARSRWGFLWLLLPLIAIAFSLAVRSQGASTTPVSVELKSVPLYGQAGAGDKPNLLLDVSVEFPTVGAQYASTTQVQDGGDYSYTETKEYLGYYDAPSCYVYNDTPGETPATGLTSADYKRFDRVGPTGVLTTALGGSNHRCDVTYPNAFSGNFLNWSTGSAIDMLRLSLSGGDRLVDTTGLTILQRAVLPGQPEAVSKLGGGEFCFFGNFYYVLKVLSKNDPVSGNGGYSGAVPLSMTQAAGSDNSSILVGNKLNQIFFQVYRNLTNGTCVMPWVANLSAPTTSPAISAAVPGVTSDDTQLYTKCADEGGYCAAFTGTRRMRYGSPDTGGHWSYFTAQNLPLQYCNGFITGEWVAPAVTPGIDPASTKSCWISVLPSLNTLPAPPGTPLNSDGFFYSRVKVCEKDGSGKLLDVRDYNFCALYPNGDYKPTGVIQKYSSNVRFGIFGYLLNQVLGGYFGAVLRAPLKFTGSKSFDSTGAENTPIAGNPGLEWDLQTGTFLTNPDSDPMNVSGVINYLNKFGRLGTTPGLYKKFDPVREMYYESLKYLQGLAPTDKAINPVPSAIQMDGFPYARTWTDPFGQGRTEKRDYTCSNTNILVIGDINTYDYFDNPTADLANNIPDFSVWYSVLDNFEKATVSNYQDGQLVTRQTTGNPTPNSKHPTSGKLPDSATSSYMYTYAYWAHTHDIRGKDWTTQTTLQRPGLRVNNFFFDVNEAGKSGITLDRHTTNQFFRAGKYGGFNKNVSTSVANPYNTFGNPYLQQDGTYNATVWSTPPANVEASHYYLSNDARGILNSFDDIFSRASTIGRSIAGAAIQTKVLTSKGSAIYQALFDTSYWSGDIQASTISVDATNAVSIAPTFFWSASAQLTAMSTPASTRNIVVGSVGGASSPTATDFTWSAISQSLKDQLNTVTATADGRGQLRLNYLRGDQSNDGVIFRNRYTKLLGDIVNSNVTYMGPPTTAISSTTYPAFRQSNLNRTPAVFSGSNDGMLHAFNANNGNELFGYIPSWMGPNLSLLTANTYNANHKGYVDGISVVADAEVGSTGTSADWKSVLVSGTGGGGPGVFALDVTDPTAFSASKVMWEFTDSDDADMNNVVGTPQILKFRTSALATTPATYKWFAVVGSGVVGKNSNSTITKSGTPALFLLDLAKPAGTAWTLGSNYYKVLFPVDATQAPTKANGLINFTATPDLENVVTQIYAGDLHGNMWKLNFTPYSTADWNMNSLSAFGAGTSNPYPLYIAQDSSGNVQPITAPPFIVRTQGSKNVDVVFGTGKFIEEIDEASAATQTFYSVFDNQSTVPDNSAGKSIVNGRGRLIAGSVNYTNGTVTVPPFTLGRPTSDTSTTRSGYYFDFTTTGERQISAMTLSGDTLVFGSVIPAASTGAIACGTDVVGGNEYHINVDNGSGSVNQSTVGILGQPIETDLDNATVSTISDSTGKRFRTTKHLVINQGSAGAATSIFSTNTVTAGRLSWRQINNYQDLKNSP